jgi:hypothetical protein
MARSFEDPQYNLAWPLAVVSWTTNTSTAMLTNVKRYLKVKREAMRLMLNGDLVRYMHKLRELNELKARAGMAI